MNPEMMEMMVASRMADLRKSARSARATRHSKTNHKVVIRSTSAKTVGELPAKARRSIGWFLVSVGMRLVVSGRRPMSVA
ncbi:MAG TPA: hypothetical protein VGH31_10130 [Acidimicrobiales bacterium]|jgi:hypothetical protein